MATSDQVAAALRSAIERIQADTRAIATLSASVQDMAAKIALLTVPADTTVDTLVADLQTLLAAPTAA